MSNSSMQQLLAVQKTMKARVKRQCGVHFDNLWPTVIRETCEVLDGNTDALERMTEVSDKFILLFNSLREREQELFSARLDRISGLTLCQELRKYHEDIEQSLCVELEETLGFDESVGHRLMSRCLKRVEVHHGLRRDARRAIDESTYLVKDIKFRSESTSSDKANLAKDLNGWVWRLSNVSMIPASPRS